MDGQKVSGIALIGDEAKLGPKTAVDGIAHPSRISFCRPLPGQALQRLLCGFPIADGLFGIVIFEIAETKADAPNENLRLGDGICVFGEKSGHFFRELQAPLGIGGQVKAGLFERQMLADAGDHIEHDTAIGPMIARVIAGEHRRTMSLAQGGDAVEPSTVPPIKARHPGHPDPARRGATQLVQGLFGETPVGFIGHEDEELALREILDRPLLTVGYRSTGAEEIAQQQFRIALFAALIADGKQLAEPPIGHPVGWIGDDIGRAVGKDQTHADEIAKTATALLVVPRRHIATHHPGKAIAVANAQRRHSHGHGMGHQFLGMRAAAQEGEIGGGDQFGIIGRRQHDRRRHDLGLGFGHLAHAKTPCRYQAGCFSPL